jgi:hypothetical protein
MRLRDVHFGKHSIKEAGYEYVRFESPYHILKEVETGKLEKWVANKNHASFGLVYKNTQLEFVSGV